MTRPLLLAILCASCPVFLQAAETPAAQAARQARELLDRNSKAHPATVAIRVRPSERVQATLVFATGGPKLDARQWNLYIPLPPELPSQRNISYEASPAVTKINEPAGLKQPLLQWQVAGGEANRKVIGVNIIYSADLLARKLTPLAAGERAPAVQPLPAEQQATFTSATPLLDFNAAAFQEWLAQNQLRPAKEETDLDFARRLFLHLKEKSAFEFIDDPDRRSSRVCKSLKSDCGGLTALYVAALRANGIPARQLVGRWAISAKKDEQLYGKPWQQEHIKADFFASGIGWVPVDISAAVDFDKKPGSLERFANDPGDFLTFHIDATIVLDVPTLGRKTVTFLQEPAVYYLGSGSFDRQISRSEWTVRYVRAGR